jgi:hypothetical protein
MSFVKVVFDSLMGPFKFLFKFLLANKKLLFNLIRWASGPIGLALLGVGAIAWLAEQLKEYFRDNVADMKVIGPKEAQALLENGNANEIANYPGGRDALVDIVQNGATKARKALDDYKSGAISKAQLNDLGGEKKLEEMVNETGLTVPAFKRLPESVQPRPKNKGQKQIQWDKLYGPRYTPEGILKDKFVDNSSPLSFNSSPTTPTALAPVEPSATPVLSTPSTSPVNDAISKNVDLVMNEYTSSGSGSTQPIVATSSNSTSSPDKAMSSSATQRDDTAIINRVFYEMRHVV